MLPVCYFAGILLLSTASLAQDHRVYAVPFHTVKGLILLDGQINGKPAAFLLDTGANISIVDYRAAGFPALKLDVLRSTCKTGQKAIASPARYRNFL